MYKLVNINYIKVLGITFYIEHHLELSQRVSDYFVSIFLRF